MLPLVIIVLGGCEGNGTDSTDIPLAAVFAGWYGFDQETGECRGGLGSTHWNDSPSAAGVVHKPEIGFYCSADPETINWQLDRIKEAGIEVLLFSWWGWGDNDLDGEVEGHPDQYMNRALIELLRQIEGRGMDLEVALIVEPFTKTQAKIEPNQLSQSQSERVLDYLWDEYYQPYRRHIYEWDERPLLVTFDPMTLPEDPRYTVRRWTGRQKNAETVNEGWEWFFGPPQDVIEARSEDGVVFVYPRFDEYFLWIMGAEHITWEPRRINPFLDQNFYRDQWKQIRQNIDDINLIVLYSWNLYGEQAHIEPSACGPGPVKHRLIERTRMFHEAAQDRELPFPSGTSTAPVREQPGEHPAPDESPSVSATTTRDGPVTCAKTDGFSKPINVGAYYYPWYGRPGQWEQAITDTPLRGKYSSRATSTIQRHLQWGRAAGVDFFAMSWPGPSSWEDVTLQQHYLRARDPIPIAIHYESAAALSKPENGPIDFEEETPGGKMRGDLFVEHMAYLAERYLTQPRYHTVGGRPVIFLYLGREWRNYGPYVAEAREKLAVGGIDPYLVADVVWWSSPAGTSWGWEPASESFDAITGYSLYDDRAPARMQDYAEQVQAPYEAYSVVADLAELDVIPGILPGFDDRALRGQGRPTIPRDDGASFRSQWRHAVTRATGSYPTVMITSFNEWHEATEIESSREHGKTYLDLTAELAGQRVQADAGPAPDRARTVYTPEDRGADEPELETSWFPLAHLRLCLNRCP